MTQSKKFLIHSSAFLFFLMLVFLPIFSLAQQPAPTPEEGIVPCNNTPVTNSDGSVTYADPCDFNAFMELINKVISFILFKMAIPIAAIMFAYAGFQLVTSGGSTEKRGIAKTVFTNAFLGLAIAVAAWLIVKTLLSVLGYKDIGTYLN